MSGQGQSADWVLIGDYHSFTEAQIVKGRLEACGIRAVVLNQSISPYPIASMVSVKLFVHPDDEVAAQELLEMREYE